MKLHWVLAVGLLTATHAWAGDYLDDFEIQARQEDLDEYQARIQRMTNRIQQHVSNLQNDLSTQRLALAEFRYKLEGLRYSSRDMDHWLEYEHRRLRYMELQLEERAMRRTSDMIAREMSRIGTPYVPPYVPPPYMPTAACPTLPVYPAFAASTCEPAAVVTYPAATYSSQKVRVIRR